MNRYEVKQDASRLVAIIVPLILIFAGLNALAGCQSVSTKAQTNSATVTRIVDGDTIVVDLNGRLQKVRLIGMNTPERGRPFYEEATEKTKELVLGKQVRLEKDVSETDKYGRLLRYVYVDDTFVNAELVKQGYALQFTLPPDVKHADLFKRLAAEAREKGTGLWASESASPPGKTRAPDTNNSIQTGTFIGNANSRIFHYSNCPYAKKIKPENRVPLSSSDDARAQGFKPCGACQPK